MTLNLTDVPGTEGNFNLGIEGIFTAEYVNATQEEFWTIIIPATGVSGTCTNDIWITGTVDV